MGGERERASEREREGKLTQVYFHMEVLCAFTTI